MKGLVEGLVKGLVEGLVEGLVGPRATRPWKGYRATSGYWATRVAEGLVEGFVKDTWKDS